MLFEAVCGITAGTYLQIATECDYLQFLWNDEVKWEGSGASWITVLYELSLVQPVRNFSEMVL